MEINSTSLATESFSYSWLVEIIKPQFHENPNENDQSFDFDVPYTHSHVALVDADEIFSDGHIMPVYVDRSRVEVLKPSTSVPASPVCLGHPNKKQRCLLEKWRKSYKRVLQKCLVLCKSRKSSRVDDLERKVCEVNSSLEASPRPSCVVDWSTTHVDKDDICCGLKRVKSCSSSPQISSSHCSDVESSIHEAILYCKRSIEK